MLRSDLLFSRLAEAEARVVVVGGLAAVLHGASYVTVDLDLCYDPGADNLTRIVQALEPFQPYPREMPPQLPFFWDERALQTIPLLTLSTSAGPVDLLDRVPGVGTYPEVEAQSVRVDVFGASVSVITLDGLIAAKRAMNRVKDQMLLPELEALQALGRQG